MKYKTKLPNDCNMLFYNIIYLFFTNVDLHFFCILITHNSFVHDINFLPFLSETVNYNAIALYKRSHFYSMLILI